MSAGHGLIGLLLPDDTSHRAFEETLADWRDERVNATSAGRRVWTEIQGCMSVLRVMLGATAREIGSLEAWRLFLWTLVTAVVIASLNPFAWNQAGYLTSGQSIRETLSLFSLLIVGSIALTFIIAAAAGPGQAVDKPVPALASLTLSVLFLFVASGWFTPFARQKAAAAASARFIAAHAHDVATAEPQGSQLDQFLRRARAEEAIAIYARRALSLRLGFVLAAPTAFLLGVAVRRRLAGSMPWRLAQCTSVAALVGCAVAGINIWPWLRGLLPWTTAASLERLEITFWLALAFAWIATLILVRAGTFARLRRASP